MSLAARLLVFIAIALVGGGMTLLSTVDAWHDLRVTRDPGVPNAEDLRIVARGHVRNNLTRLVMLLMVVVLVIVLVLIAHGIHHWLLVVGMAGGIDGLALVIGYTSWSELRDRRRFKRAMKEEE